MKRGTASDTTTVVVVLGTETDAGYQLTRRLLAEGRRVVAVTRHPLDAVRIMHGHPADRIMVIAADTADQRQWRRVIELVTGRFGRIDTVLRADDAVLRASA
jgi:NAD(P)-dependent dehydrogenase (short-subunit alcohol dehydrogenase family)